jgi:hypothetical protein
MTCPAYTTFKTDAKKLLCSKVSLRIFTMVYDDITHESAYLLVA